MAQSRTVALAGAGVVSAGCVGASGSIHGACGAQAIDWLTLFDPPGGCEHAAEVDDAYDWKTYLLSSQHYASRATMLAAGAARMALDEAGLELPLADPSSCGVCLGTHWGCIDSAEKFYGPVLAGQARRASAQVFSHSYPNSTASMLAIDFHLGGYSNVFAGCAFSGMHALQSGFMAVADGTAQMMLVGAVDALDALVVADGEHRGRYADTAGEEIDFSDPSNAAIASRVPGEAAVFLLLCGEDCSTGNLKRPICLEQIINSPAENSEGLLAGDSGAVGPLFSFLHGLLG